MNINKIIERSDLCYSYWLQHDQGCYKCFIALFTAWVQLLKSKRVCWRTDFYVSTMSDVIIRLQHEGSSCNYSCCFEILASACLCAFQVTPFTSQDRIWQPDLCWRSSLLSMAHKRVRPLIAPDGWSDSVDIVRRRMEDESSCLWRKKGQREPLRTGLVLAVSRG